MTSRNVLKDCDTEDNEANEQNQIYLNDRAQKISSLTDKSVESDKQDSSSETDFVDSVDSLHETLLLKRNANIRNKDSIPLACAISRSSSFSGVTEKEILCSKIKELYHLYSNIAEGEDRSSKQKETGDFNANDLRYQESEKSKRKNFLTSCTKGDIDKCTRAGRYNKKAAPVPPTQNKPNELIIKQDDTASAIKATLVLKPGVVKPIGAPRNDESRQEVFLSHSPKLKRRTKSKSKFDLPISRLMMLPKKMVFWNKDNAQGNKQDASKRSSWYETLSSGQKLDPQFRSHENLYSHYLSVSDGVVPPGGVVQEGQFRPRKLSASPTLCRRIERTKIEKECL